MRPPRIGPVFFLQFSEGGRWQGIEFGQMGKAALKCTTVLVVSTVQGKVGLESEARSDMLVRLMFANENSFLYGAALAIEVEQCANGSRRFFIVHLDAYLQPLQSSCPHATRHKRQRIGAGVPAVRWAA